MNERSRPVLVTGATGLVGTHTCRELLRRGWKVRALARDVMKSAIRLGHLPLELRIGDVRNRSDLDSALDGCGAVVHLAAIAIEAGRNSYRETNTSATATLIEAARAKGVRRLVYMSQSGADSASPHAFLRSKGIAQDAVTQSGLDWTVLRPSVIFGREDEFVNVLARLVRLSPLVFPLPDGGCARFQPISVDDVARAVAESLARRNTIGGVYGIGGPVPLSLREMTDRILTAMRVSRRIVPIPVSVLRPVVALMQRILPNPPVTTGLLALLSADNTVPDNAIESTFETTPVPFAPEEIGYLRAITTSSALSSLFRKG